MLKLGERIISNLYLGDKRIAKAFLGDKLVYQSGKPIFLDYIESNGIACINTDLKPSYDYTIKIRYQYTSLIQTYNPIFGMRLAAVGTGNGLFWVGMHFNEKKAYLRFGENSVNYAMGAKALDVIEMTCSPEGIFINGEDTGARYFNGEITSEAKPICLFTINGESGISANLGETNAKVYSYQVFDRDMNLIQDLRPCLHPKTLKACMYDMVTKKYFYNQGTGELKPSGRFVTSILFDGASYIDTGLAHQTCTIEVDLRFEETGTRQLMGFATSTAQYWGKGANSSTIEYFSGTNVLDRTLVTLQYNTDDPTAPTVIKSADGRTSDVSKGSSIANYTYTIGAVGTAVKSYWCTCEVWGQKTYVNGELIQNLRPYVDEDGVACFYDTVTNVKFYNKGTGTLSYTE